MEDNNMNQQTQDASSQMDVQAIEVDTATSKTYTEADIVAITEKYEQEKQSAIDDAIKKAKMSSDEALAYEQEQKAKQLEEKEKSLILKELQADTKILLAEKELPADMLDFLIAGNKENTVKRVEAFKAAYDKAVQEGITKAIAGKTPAAGSVGATSSSQSGFLQAVLENQAKRN